MRHSLYVLLTGVVVAALTAPQGVQAQTIVVGAKVGASFSRLSNSPHEDADINNLATFVGGGYVRFMFGRFGFQPEVLAVTKGADFDDSGLSDVELKIDYVEVPLMGVVTFPYGRLAPYVMAGPTFAVAVRCRAEFRNGNTDDTEVQFDCDDPEAVPFVFARESFDIGLTVGGGLLIRVGPGAALLEARYTHGLTDINDTEFADTTIRNRSAYLMAGYAYPIARRR